MPTLILFLWKKVNPNMDFRLYLGSSSHYYRQEEKVHAALYSGHLSKAKNWQKYS